MRSGLVVAVVAVAWVGAGCRAPQPEPVAPAAAPTEADHGEGGGAVDPGGAMDPGGAVDPGGAAAETDGPRGAASRGAAGGAAAQTQPHRGVEISGPEPGAPEPVTGIEVCDQYLSLYERCEPILRPEIMAGDRRPVHAEREWFRHVAGTPEKEVLPDACRQRLDELRPRCPVPEPPQ